MWQNEYNAPLAGAPSWFGKPATNEAIDESILRTLGKLVTQASADYDYIKGHVRAETHGDVEERHLVERMIALQSRKRIVCIRVAKGKKGSSTYRIATPSDHEKPQWPNRSSS